MLKDQKMPLSILQIILIVLLLIIVPLGLWNQRRMKKKQLELENFNYNNSQQNTINTEISIQEQNAKKYIEQYKNQYSKESLKSVLINNGSNELDVNNWIAKYF